MSEDDDRNDKDKRRGSDSIDKDIERLHNRCDEAEDLWAMQKGWMRGIEGALADAEAPLGLCVKVVRRGGREAGYGLQGLPNWKRDFWATAG